MKRVRVMPKYVDSLTYRELNPGDAMDLPHIAWAEPMVEEGSFHVFGAVTPESKVIATQGIMLIRHWEGFWVDREYRGIPVIQQKLSGSVHQFLQEINAPASLTIALDNSPFVVQAIEKQGGTYVGRVYAIPTRKES